MTNRECIFVICGISIVAAFAILFVGPTSHVCGSDRSANLMNIRNCQQAMRGEQFMKELAAGEPFTHETLEEFMQYPAAVNPAVGHYENRGEITPESEEPATNWDHIWLIPSAAGLPGGEFGHDSYGDVTGW